MYLLALVIGSVIAEANGKGDEFREAVQMAQDKFHESRMRQLERKAARSKSSLTNIVAGHVVKRIIK